MRHMPKPEKPRAPKERKTKERKTKERKTKAVKTKERKTKAVKPYFISRYESGFVMAPNARKVTIPGFGDFEFFIEKSDGRFYGPRWCDPGWGVHEAKTGQIIGRGKTRKEAIQITADGLAKHGYGVKKLQKVINEAIAKFGLSPRYTV